MSDTNHLDVPSSVADPDLTGRKLGDFHLLRKLGRGGMGEVYLAEQSSLKRQVAVKVLRPSLATDANYVQRFSHEARAAAKLTHANIVQIYEVGCSDGIHYIAQEYVPGNNLRQLLTRRGRPLDLPQVILIMRQVGAALHKAGEQGIVHRDIKPENIMLTPEGEVKVADFGLARITMGGDSLYLTQFGMTMGSPLYMSPEQAEGRPVDPRSDLYSFGATCFHMLANRPPFTGDSPLAIAVQHVKSEPPALEELRPDLPRGLCRIVHRLLAKTPEERFASAAEMLRALRALRSEGVSDELLEGVDGWSTPELIALGEARLPATEHLDRVMRTQAMLVQRRMPLGIIAAMLLAGLFAGTVLGRAMAPSPLLAVPKSQRLNVKRMYDAKAQLSYAMLEDTEDAWKAVPIYFPPEQSATNLNCARKASKGLADLYYQQGRFTEAADLYRKLTELNSAEVQFRTQGHAGLALVYAAQGRDDLAKGELVQVQEHLSLLDQATADEIRRLAERLEGRKSA